MELEQARHTGPRGVLPTSHYDRSGMNRAVSFIQSLKHTKGVWAGKPFLLFPWQEQIIRDIFGTIKANGCRQFNTAFTRNLQRRPENSLRWIRRFYDEGLGRQWGTR